MCARISTPASAQKPGTARPLASIIMSDSKKQKVEGGAADVERLQKQCLTVLKAVQRKKEAMFFLEPVNWKALDLPLYPTLIKKPMDLGTVERNLQESKFKTVNDFCDAVNLVFSNAQTFNLEGSDIYSFAAICKEAFDSKMADIDSSGRLRVKVEASKSGGGGGGTKEPETQVGTCKKIVNELKKSKSAELFLAPVDWKTLGLIDYPLVIKKPMDLGTISHNLESGKYHSSKSCIADVDLVFANAMTYNLDGSFIYAAAESLKAEAKKKFAAAFGGGGGGGGGSSGGGSSASGGGGGGGGGSSGSSGKAKAAGGPGALSGEELAACKKAVNELKKNKSAEIFLAPVDWKTMGLLNYLAVVKRPMDLGTISANLDSRKYDSARGVADDIDQVWTNAMTYNLEGSFAYEAAADMKRLSDQKMSSLLSGGVKAEPEPEVTYDMRKQLNEDVAQLTPGQLCGFLRVVQASCRRAVTDGADGDVEVDLDTLDLPAFVKIDEYVSEAVGRRKTRVPTGAR